MNCCIFLGVRGTASLVLAVTCHLCWQWWKQLKKKMISNSFEFSKVMLYGGSVWIFISTHKLGGRVTLN
jgi:hypothetical protein